ncbi:probable RNA-directed DNA polymerase from transposon X-element [Aspergillus lentulus]|nr:probable RNA-directed DNA polymerase from transposon X-element [Aspergillus lentulus]
MQIEGSKGTKGSTTAEKATRPSKGSKKTRSEPSRRQPPRGQAPTSTSTLTSMPDQNVNNISFTPLEPYPKASTVEDNDHPLKQPRNQQTTTTRGTHLNIYQDNPATADAELPDTPESDWQPSSVLQDKDTNTNSSTQAEKKKQKQGMDTPMQLEKDPQVNFAETRTPQFTSSY